MKVTELTLNIAMMESPDAILSCAICKESVLVHVKYFEDKLTASKWQFLEDEQYCHRETETFTKKVVPLQKWIVKYQRSFNALFIYYNRMIDLTTWKMGVICLGCQN
jgi:hypothetical protein